MVMAKFQRQIPKSSSKSSTKVMVKFHRPRPTSNFQIPRSSSKVKVKFQSEGQSNGNDQAPKSCSKVMVMFKITTIIILAPDWWTFNLAEPIRCQYNYCCYFEHNHDF